MTGSTERIAVMSDVHGNLTALEAVLADIAVRGITRIFNLGDLVGKGPRSAEVVDRCRQVCETIVQGNWDADVAAGKSANAAPMWHRSQLGSERNLYLANLSGSVDYTLGGRAARFYHASQVSPSIGSTKQHRARFTAKCLPIPTLPGMARFRFWSAMAIYTRPT